MKARPWVLYGLAAAVMATLVAFPDAISRLRSLGMETELSDPECSLAEQGCLVEFADGLRLRLEATPKGMVPATPLDFVVELSDPQAAVEFVVIQGLSMNMGQTRVPLSEEAPGRWVGHGALPVCTLESMKWRADVVLESDERSRMAGFEFWSHGEQRAPALDLSERTQPTYGDIRVQGPDGPIALSDLRGKAVVVYFGYTACPDICPTTLSTVAAAFEQLSPQDLERSAGLFVSVDPERDAPERLGEYGAFFHPQILAGTSELEQVGATAADWGVSFRKVQGQGSAMQYTVDHSTAAYLVGPDGQLAQVLPHGTPATDIARAIHTTLNP